MGCVQSGEKKGRTAAAPGGETDGLPTSQPKEVDPRLPFDNYRQLFNLKNSWKAVSRSMERTAKECLIRFFLAHPEHQRLHGNLASLSESEMRGENAAFEEEAVFFFNTLDELMGCVDDKVDMAITLLRNAGQQHYYRIAGFEPSYLKDMERHFLDSIRETLGDRFNENAEQNFRRIYEFSLTHILNK